MVEQRSPKPSIWVRILVLLPIDFTENQTTQGDMKQCVEPLPHWEIPCFWFSFVIVLYRFILHHIPHLFPIGADGVFFRVKKVL